MCVEKSGAKQFHTNDRKMVVKLTLIKNFTNILRGVFS